MPGLSRGTPRRPPVAGLLIAAAVLGCADPDDGVLAPIDPESLVPVAGVVTWSGEPLATALVTFLPPSGVPALGETDRAGRYELRTARMSGVVPGEYKVAISYLVSAEGNPQGLGARNATFPTPELVSAKERLPPDYSDFWRTGQRAVVTARGGTFDFKITAPRPGPPAGGGPETAASGTTRPAGPGEGR